MMLISEMLYQYCDGHEASMEGNKYRVEVPLFLCGLFWRISSHFNKLTISHISQCALKISVLQQDQAIRATAVQ